MRALICQFKQDASKMLNFIHKLSKQARYILIFLEIIGKICIKAEDKKSHKSEM